MDSIDFVIYDHIMNENQALKQKVKKVEEKLEEMRKIELSNEVIQEIEKEVKERRGVNADCLQPAYIYEIEDDSKDLVRVVVEIFLQKHN